MSRRLPMCGVCGESLAHRGRVTLSYGSLPGRPEIGWHDKCLENEPLRDALWADLAADRVDDAAINELVGMLLKIGSRGDGRRLVANQRWSHYILHVWPWKMQKLSCLRALADERGRG